MKTKIISIFILFVVVFGVYANSVTNEFTNWDDDKLVVHNPAIRSLDVGNLIKIFNPVKGGTFQPVRVLSYALDYHFFGLNPIGYHIHSIFLQFGAAVFLYLSLLYMIPALLVSGSPFQGSCSEKVFHNGFFHAVALLAAILFAIHPVQVESVVWLSGRKYTLLGFFSFLSLYFFLLYETGRSGNKPDSEFLKPAAKQRISSGSELELESESDSDSGATSWLLCKANHRCWIFLCAAGSFMAALCAVLSSPFGIMLPVLFLWYDFCVKRNLVKIFKQRFWIYFPYGFLFVSMAMILRSALFAGSFFKGSHSVQIKTLCPSLFTLLRVIFDYVRNLLFPFWLNARYMDVISYSIFQPKVMISLVSIIGIIVLVFKGYVKEKKMVMFCCGWFFIAFSPASNIFPISTEMADRYIYLASAGPFIYASFLMCRFAVRCCYQNVPGGFPGRFCFSGQSGWRNKLPPILIALLIIFFSVISIKRNMVWKNSITLWTNSLKIEPRGFLAENNLGQAYADKGDFQTAVKHYNSALSMKEDLALVHNNLAKCYTATGDNKKAVYHYLRALELAPWYADAHNNIGNYFLKRGMLKKARYHLNEALKKCRGCAEVYNNLSLLCLDSGDVKGALKNIRKAISLRADFAEAYNNLGKVLAAGHEYDKALFNFRHAAKLNLCLPEPFCNAGVMFVMLGKYRKAEISFKKALKVDPEYTYALNNLGNLYIMEKKTGMAIECYRKVLKIDSDNVAASARLAWLLSAYESPLRDVKEALGCIKRAVLKSGKNDPVLFDILAETYAANGDFDNAVRFVMRGMNLAQKQHRKILWTEMRKRAEMYMNKKIYIEKINP